MSKAAEARVRDELLQRLYAHTLRARLVCTHAGASAAEDAFAAGIVETLRAGDLLLTPAAKGAALRTLRSVRPRQHTRAGAATDLCAGVAQLPIAEAAGVQMALGAAMAAKAHVDENGASSLVLVLLPKSPAAEEPAPPKNAVPATWAGALAYAAQLALPLVAASFGVPLRSSKTPAHLRPAPLFPTIPVDESDALATYRVAFECAQRARAAMGPSYIAGVGFRVPGQPEQGDGLARLETMLRQRRAFQKAQHRQLERGILAELDEAES